MNEYYLRLFEELLTSDEPEELEVELEANTTSNVPGYQTPYAFDDDEDGEGNEDAALQLGYTLAEELTPDDEQQVRTLIRVELAKVFFDLYRKRGTWERG